MNAFPKNLVYKSLEGSSAALHSLARQFCLEQIKENYGFDYRPDWHSDLDSLLKTSAENHYSMQNHGSFWLLLDPSDKIIASVALRSLAWKTDIVKQFSKRYSSIQEVGSLWRVYVQAAYRRHGIGRELVNKSEEYAIKNGYNTLYLHCSASSINTIQFWESMGYMQIENDGVTSHYDKKLKKA